MLTLLCGPVSGYGAPTHLHACTAPAGISHDITSHISHGGIVASRNDGCCLAGAGIWMHRALSRRIMDPLAENNYGQHSTFRYADIMIQTGVRHLAGMRGTVRIGLSVGVRVRVGLITLIVTLTLTLALTRVSPDSGQALGQQYA